MSTIISVEDKIFSAALINLCMLDFANLYDAGSTNVVAEENICSSLL